MSAYTPAVLSLLLCLLPSARPHSSGDAEPVDVGDSTLRGKALAPFDARWKTGSGVVVHEESERKRLGGRACYVRQQVWPMNNGLELHSELVLDAKTLATVSFQREIVGLPEGAGLGGQAEFVRWEFDGADFERVTRRRGKESKSTGSLPAPMFEGSGLGLVLATLPLEEGYSARLPVAMPLGLAEDLTQYEVVARVVGTEAFAREKGKDVPAWIVEVDWIDPETGEVTSPGGAEQAGGAYCIVTKPPRGFPHVARYQNDSSLIELMLGKD